MQSSIKAYLVIRSFNDGRIVPLRVFVNKQDALDWGHLQMKYLTDLKCYYSLLEFEINPELFEDIIAVHLRLIK